MPFSARASPLETITITPAPATRNFSTEVSPDSLPHWLLSTSNGGPSIAARWEANSCMHSPIQTHTPVFRPSRHATVTERTTIPVLLHVNREGEIVRAEYQSQQHELSAEVAAQKSCNISRQVPVTAAGVPAVPSNNMYRMQAAPVQISTPLQHAGIQERITMHAPKPPALPDISLKDLHDQLTAAEANTNGEAVHALASALEQYAHALKSASKSSAAASTGLTASSPEIHRLTHLHHPAVAHMPPAEHQLSPPSISNVACSTSLSAAVAAGSVLPLLRVVPAAEIGLSEECWVTIPDSDAHTCSRGISAHNATVRPSLHLVTTDASECPVLACTQMQIDVGRQEVKMHQDDSIRPLVHVPSPVSKTSLPVDAKINLLTEALRPLLQQLVEHSGAELDQILSSQPNISRESVLEWVLQHCGNPRLPAPMNAPVGQMFQGGACHAKRCPDLSHAGSNILPTSAGIVAVPVGKKHAASPSDVRLSILKGTEGSTHEQCLAAGANDASPGRLRAGNDFLPMARGMSAGSFLYGNVPSPPPYTQIPAFKDAEVAVSQQGVAVDDGSSSRADDSLRANKRLCVRLVTPSHAGPAVEAPRLELGLGLPSIPVSSASEQRTLLKLNDTSPIHVQSQQHGHMRSVLDATVEGWDARDDSSPTSTGTRKPRRCCQYPGCEKHSQLNTHGHQLYCIAHMRQCGMQPRRQSCSHEGCTKEVVTSLDGQRTFCKAHMREHGLVPRYRQCQHGNCMKQVKTSSDGQRLYCKSHMREHGMKPKYKPCQHPGCENRAEPCMSGEHTYCKSHMRARGLEPKYK